MECLFCCRFARRPHHCRHLFAEHKDSEFTRRELTCFSHVDIFTAPEDSQPLAELQHLVHLMANEENGTVLRLQVAQKGKKTVNFLRTQYRGRFVKNQDARIAGERSQDFDALF